MSDPVEIVETYVDAAAEAAMRANGGVLPQDFSKLGPGERFPEGVVEPPDSRGRVYPSGMGETRLLPRTAKLERVQKAQATRATPFGRIRLAWAPLTAIPLIVPPKVQPLRGKRVNDWRIELLLTPNEKPTPKWRRFMRDRFGQALCGLYRTTPNPFNPLPQSVEGWWWHGGVWTACELGDGIRMGNDFKDSPIGLPRLSLSVSQLSPTEGRRWAIWLEAKAAGVDLEVSP